MISRAQTSYAESCRQVKACSKQRGILNRNNTLLWCPFEASFISLQGEATKRNKSLTTAVDSGLVACALFSTPGYHVIERVVANRIRTFNFACSLNRCKMNSMGDNLIYRSLLFVIARSYKKF